MHYTKQVATFHVLALTALTFAPSLCRAEPLPYTTWTPFSWMGGPNAVQTQSPFTFTANQSFTLDVTDAFAQGDRFQVRNLATGNELIGMTTQINGPANFMINPNDAFASDGFSHGSFLLPQGSYALSFKNIQIAQGAPNGTAYFRLTPTALPPVTPVVPPPDLAQVPEPGTLILAACGVAGLAYPGLRRWGRRREEPQPE